MIGELIQNARRHTVAYVALIFSLLALGGGAYADLRLPKASIKAFMIKNHILQPVKFDSAYISGFVRHWATIGSQGQVLASSSAVFSTLNAAGQGQLIWGDGFSSHCGAVANVTGPGGAGSTGGYVDTAISPSAGNPTAVDVGTFNNSGQPTPEPFYVAVICPPGAGPASSVPYAPR